MELCHCRGRRHRIARQRAAGIVVVSNQRGYTQSQVQKILQFIDDLAFARITDDEQDFLDYGDGAVENALGATMSTGEPGEPPPPKAGPKLQAPKLLEPAEYPWDSPDPEKSVAKSGSHVSRRVPKGDARP